MRIRAKNKPGTTAYYQEPYTVQHFTDWALDMGKMVFWDIPAVGWTTFRYLTSKRYRQNCARQYNEMLFGFAPREQTVVFDEGVVRPLTDEEWKKYSAG